MTIILIGHVTKDGELAGPNTLKHIVDTVLYFEGDLNSPYRIIRAIKNRFGAVNEVGIFSMTELGIISIEDASSIFSMSNSHQFSGGIVTSAWLGTRPLLLEVQGLIEHDETAKNLKIKTVGINTDRAQLVSAVLNKHYFESPVYGNGMLNIVSGIQLEDTAVDLGAALALVSSMENITYPHNLIVLGEIGLKGEIRQIQNINQRLKDALRCGYTSAIIPYDNAVNIRSENKAFEGMAVFGAKSVKEAIEYANEQSSPSKYT